MRASAPAIPFNSTPRSPHGSPAGKPVLESEACQLCSGTQRDVTTLGRLPETPAGGFCPARAPGSGMHRSRSAHGLRGDGGVHLRKCSSEMARGKFLQLTEPLSHPGERGALGPGVSPRATVLPSVPTASPLRRTSALNQLGGGGL